MTRATLTGLANTACRDVWGEPCAVNGQAVTAILDIAPVSVDAGGEVPQQGVAPVLDVILASMPIAPAQGQTVMAGGNTYRIANVEPDGNGGAKLILQVA